MKFFAIFALSLIFSPIALSQDKEVIELKAEFEFGDGQGYIWWSRTLEGETKLLLVGERNIQLLDIENAKLLESRAVKLPEFRTSFRYDPRSDWVISPDGRKMLIIGHHDSKDGSKQLAWVWDLQTGERVAVLDKSPKSIFAGEWSKNGKTLVTNARTFMRNEEISFWDGETFAYRASMTAHDMTWCRLSDDGTWFIAALGRISNPLFLRFKGDKIGGLNVWETGAGKIAQAAPMALNPGIFNSFYQSEKVSISRDGRLLAFIQQYKSNDPNPRLIVWELDGEIRQKYEVKLDPKIDNPRIALSSDGKRFALVAGKVTRIYETQTGEKRFELQGSDLPYEWLNDNNVLLYVKYKIGWSSGRKYLEAFDIASGKMLYMQKLIYEEPREPETGVEPGHTDDTAIIPHPGSKIFLTYSDNYVKLFDSQTGECLQKIVTPVWRAGWSYSGKSLYVISADRRSVSLWKWTGN
jgi:WD40 repeat protein